MLTDDVPIPVYFTNYNEEVEKIISEISYFSRDSKQKDSAIVEIFNKISQNGYQVVVTGASNSPKKDSKIPIIQGDLIPFKTTASKSSSDLPVIIISTALKKWVIRLLFRYVYALYQFFIQLRYHLQWLE